MRQILLGLRALLVATAFVVLWTWLAVSVRPLDADVAVSVPSWLRPVGWLLALAGGLLVSSCIWVFFSRGRGTPAPFDPPREFVGTGPYRYVRNPMYWGAILVIFGAGLVVRSPSIAALAIVFALLAHLFVVLYEEPSLEARFGTSYVQYKSSVHRWLPARPKHAEDHPGR
jgi:protein-S-isoprenylcysteine O-methyltransferase Ste14